jgi:phosphoribosylglycinamide formyltransferase-1
MINAVIFASGEGSNSENLVRYFATDPRIRIKFIVASSEKAGIVARAHRLRKPVHILSRDSLVSKAIPFVNYLKQEKIGLIILAGWLLKIPQEFIDAFRGRIINIHPALLPGYGGKGMYGLNVHRAVIAGGEKESGITIHYVDEEYDSGDIILQEKCPVMPEDTPETLSARVRELEFRYFPLAVEKIIGALEERA